MRVIQNNDDHEKIKYFITLIGYCKELFDTIGHLTQYRLAKRWPNVGTVVPKFGQRYYNLHLLSAIFLSQKQFPAV